MVLIEEDRIRKPSTNPGQGCLYFLSPNALKE